MFEYTLPQWVMFFYLYCFVGWIWESCYVSIKKKRWVNRGFLHLPLLPLYGTGAVSVLFVTLPVRGNLFLIYILGSITAVLLELAVGLGMETLYKVKYWDYTNRRFNYRGVICLQSALCWGFLTLFLVEIAQSPLERLVYAMPAALLYVLDGAIGAAVLYDAYISNKAALQLARVITAMEKAKLDLQADMANLEIQLSEQRSLLEARLEYARRSAEIRAEDAKLVLEIQAELAKENLARRAAKTRANLEGKKLGRLSLADLRDTYRQKKREQQLRRQDYNRHMEELMGRAEIFSRSMIRRNPTVRFPGHEEIVRELRKRSEKWRKR